ncbi:MAG: hypothetical protein H0W90_07985 [Actinobacteria bacterium]|nr:hypothetical protein [Actinomycetota bacterium]
MNEPPPTNVLRDADGRVVYEGDLPPEDAQTTSSGQTAAGASPWRTAQPQSEEEADRPALETDYKKAFASLDGRLGSEH